MASYGLVRKDTSLNAATGFSAHVSSMEGLGQQNLWNQYGRVSQYICSMWFKYVQALLVQTGFQLSTLNCYFLVWQPVLDYRFLVSSLLTILFFSHFPTLDSLDLVWSGNKCSKTKHLGVRSTKYPQFFHFPHFPHFAWFPENFPTPKGGPQGVPRGVPQVRRHAAPGALPSQPGGGAARPDGAPAPAAAPGRRGDAAGALLVGRRCHDGLLRGEHGEPKSQRKKPWHKGTKMVNHGESEILADGCLVGKIDDRLIKNIITPGISF